MKVDGRPASSGRDSPDPAARFGGVPDSMVAYAPLRPFLLWSVETARTVVGMQREMIDLTRGVVRQQQDTMIAAMLRSLGEDRADDRAASRAYQTQDGLASLARFSLSAFERMAIALRPPADAGPSTSAPGATPGRATEPR